MAKRIDPLKAKQAKQKKIAIGLSVFFVAVLALQGPKTLKLLKGPETIPDSVSAAMLAEQAATAPGGIPPTGAPAAGGPVPAGEAQPAVLVDSDAPSAPGEGQLLSFEQFAAKDPFAQQVKSSAVSDAVADALGGSGPLGPATGSTKPEMELGGVPTGTVLPGSDTGSGSGTSPGSGTSAAPAAGPAAPPSAQPAAPATATTISLNGEPVEIAADGSFPAADPVFVLVSTATDGKSVEIGVAGGTYAGGGKTVTLKLGKPLTLQNTADGSRFELELLSVSGFVPPKTKG